eukprot:1140300-Lingulodinium_polyedra.AAC.1
MGQKPSGCNGSLVCWGMDTYPRSPPEPDPDICLTNNGATITRAWAPLCADIIQRFRKQNRALCMRAMG